MPRQGRTVVRPGGYFPPGASQGTLVTGGYVHPDTKPTVQRYDQIGYPLDEHVSISGGSLPIGTQNKVAGRIRRDNPEMDVQRSQDLALGRMVDISRTKNFNQVLSTLARSSIPSRDIRGYGGSLHIDLRGIDPSVREHTGFKEDPYGPLGTYEARSSRHYNEPAVTVNVPPGHKDFDRTLVHEIGHHASHRQGGMKINSWGDRGREEAVANAYERRHTEPRRQEAQTAYEESGGKSAGADGGLFNQDQSVDAFNNKFVQEHLAQGGTAEQLGDWAKPFVRERSPLQGRLFHPDWIE